MARRRFFVDSIRERAAELAGEDAVHLARVLRAEPGQRYEISDNQSFIWPRSKACAKTAWYSGCWSGWRRSHRRCV